MGTSNFWRSTWWLIGSNRFVDKEPCRCISPRAMTKRINRTSRTVGMPSITISTTCCNQSHFSVAFSHSTSESSISQYSGCIGRTALPPANSSFPVPMWLDPWAPSHMRSPNSWDHPTAVMELLLMLWSKTLEYYSRFRKTQSTVRQYTMAHGSSSSIRVVRRRIYRMNNCMQWSSVYTMISNFKLRV